MVADKKNSGARTLPLLPLRELLVFPHTVVPLFVGREKSVRALDEAMAHNREIFLAAQKKQKTNDPTPDEIYEFGTIAQILQLLRLPDGTVKILVEGKKRGKIVRYVDTADILTVEVQEVLEPQGNAVENEALVRTVKSSFDTYCKLNKKVPPEMVFSISAIENESRLADTLVVQLSSFGPAPPPPPAPPPDPPAPPPPPAAPPDMVEPVRVLSPPSPGSPIPPATALPPAMPPAPP